MAMNKCTVFEENMHLELMKFLKLVILCLMAFFSPSSSTPPSPVQLLRNSAYTIRKLSLNPQGLIRCPCWGTQLYPVFTRLRYFSYLILKVYLPSHLFPLLSSEALTVLAACTILSIMHGRHATFTDYMNYNT